MIVEPSRKSKRRIQAAVILLLSIVLSAACSMPSLRRPVAPAPSATILPTPLPQPTATQRALPPALLESNPPQGAEIPLAGLITLYFNQPMDRDSVEEAVKVRAFLLSDLIWSDDATVTLNPGQQLPPDSSLTVEVGTEARSSSGLTLREPISLTYRTVGFLQPSQRLPEPDSVDVNPTSAIVASFNHPVVPLGADQAALPVAFTLEPAASGRGEWINTSTYIFYPEPALAGGRTYQVLVNRGLYGIDGNPLLVSEEQPLDWSFSTSLPRIESTPVFSDAYPMALDHTLSFSFNQPMDPTSVEANFRLIGPSDNLVTGKFDWRDNHTAFDWSPVELLERGVNYRLELDGQAQAYGGTPLGETYLDSLPTIPELSIARTEPEQGGVLENYTGITLYTSGPFDSKSLPGAISVEPAVSNLTYQDNSGTRTYFNDQGEITGEELYRGIFVYGDFLPSTDYRLTVSSQLSDPWGSSLGGASGEPFTLDFRSAPLEPGVQIGSSYSNEHYLTTQDNGVVAQVSGLTSLPISLGSLPVNDFLRTKDWEFLRSYRPADQQSWQQATGIDPDRTQDVVIYLQPDQQSLPSGIYMMRIALPGENREPATNILVVSDVHLVFKLSATDAMVWAIDVDSNTPVTGAPVSIYEYDGKVLATGTTDAEGIFQASFEPRAEPYNGAVAVLGQPGEATFAVADATWSQDIQPWSFDLNADYQRPRQQAYLYTDRPIYRPGQSVYFRGILRQAYNGRYEIPDVEGQGASANLSAQLFDDAGQQIDSLDLSLSDFGTFNGQFDLPADLRPGMYSLNIPELDYGAINIPVADYRKPEINLQVDVDSPDGIGQAQAGELLQGSINARYFFDAPAGNVPLSWSLYRTPGYFNLPGYTVGLQGASQWYSPRQYAFGRFVTSGEGVTQPDGMLQLDLGQAASDPELQRYTLEVNASDESGLPVSARDEILVHPADFYIGARADSWVGRLGEPFGFDVQTVDWDQVAAGDRPIRAEFAKVTWVPDEALPPDPMIGTIYKPELDLIASSDLRTGADGRARLEFTPPEPGPYQLSLTSQLTGDNQARTEMLVWVGGPGQFVLPDQFNRHLAISADQDSYQPGDTARIFIPNPFPTSVPALVTTERGTILSHQTQMLEPGGTTLSLPLNTDDAPNIYLSVTLLGKDDQDQPDYRQGYLNLPVAPVEQTLNVQITRQPEVTGPGEMVDFEILVTDSKGEPVQGEFSLAVVDMAALALADPNSIDILPYYYGNQPLGVHTGVMLSVYAGRKVERPFAGGAGGGGGDGGPVVRERFPDTAFWQADIVTDAQGKAQVSLTLPDSLTTWQAETRGVTQDTRVGQAKTQVVTTKDLLVRPVTPRFLVAGDRLELAAVVQNNTDHTVQGEVSLQAQGFQLDDPASSRQPFSIEAGGRQRVSWWGSVEDLPSARLVFSATADNGALQDAALPVWGELPILHYSAPQTFRTAGTIDSAEERLELVSLPRFYDPTAGGANNGSLELELSSSLAATMLKALEVLEGTECDCNELTLSRFLPNLEMYRTFQDFGLQSPDLQNRLERSLDESLRSLLNRQNFDGGWGWWQKNSYMYDGESSSDLLITAYILFGLSRASGAGVLSNQQPIERAISYLSEKTTYETLPENPGELDRLAFAGFALAQAGAGNLEALQRLYPERASLSPWAQALLALALERTSPGSQEARTLISDLESSAVRTAAGAHWELGEADGANLASTLTNSAIVTYALAQRDPGAPLVSEAARYLIANRQADGGWTTSYTTAWTLMALNEVMKATAELGGDFAFNAAVNDAVVASGQAAGAEQLTPVVSSLPLSRLHPDSPNLLAIERGTGTGRLYYSAMLNVSRPAEQAEPLSQGMSLSRQYFLAGLDCTRETCTPIQSANQREKVQVRLTLNVPRDAYHVMVEDFIPAGAEILDLRLQTSQQGQGGEPDASQLYDPGNPYAKGWGWWFFNTPSIFDDHILWSAENLPAGTYELTYTIVPLQAGEFQVLPAHAWENYFPETQATSAGNKFTIK